MASVCVRKINNVVLLFRFAIGASLSSLVQAQPNLVTPIGGMDT